jgi:hypothetical protein
MVRFRLFDTDIQELGIDIVDLSSFFGSSQHADLLQLFQVSRSGLSVSDPRFFQELDLAVGLTIFSISDDSLASCKTIALMRIP